ncbi:MAG: MupG family TIM beta-alpha barrel fold protein [Sulfolobaceae archaeon]|nr:MupG family TIM beta-alpha barrel fold protein [Sulfolobaceae archaeon]
MRLGISIFPGWKEIKSEQMELIKKANEYGYSQIFMGIGPGTHWRTPVTEAFKEAKEYLELANKLGYYVFFDVNPEIFRELSVSPQTVDKFKDYGFSAIRVDYGFSVEQIIEMSKKIKIELNPFEFPLNELDSFLQKVDMEKVAVSHNYYPVYYTAISLSDAVEKSKRFKEKGLSVGAFVDNSKFRLRTTVETLRFKTPGYAGRLLFLAGVADRILIGDPVPYEDDLLSLKNSFIGDSVLFNVITEREVKQQEQLIHLVCEVKDFMLQCRSNGNVECEREEVNSLEKGNVILNCKDNRSIIIGLKDTYGIVDKSYRLGEIVEKELLDFKPTRISLKIVKL